MAIVQRNLSPFRSRGRAPRRPLPNQNLPSGPAVTIQGGGDRWNTYQRIFNELRQGMKADILEQAGVTRGREMQRLISSGMSGSTVAGNVMSGIGRQAGRDIASMRGRIAGQAMRLTPGMMPEPEMDVAGARSLGRTMGMSQMGGNVPEWFQRMFAEMNRPQRPRKQRVTLSYR